MSDKVIEEFAEKVKKIICEHTYPYFDKDKKPVSIWNADGYKEIDKLIREIAEQMRQQEKGENKFGTPDL